MIIDIVEVNRLINEILAGLARAKPTVELPYDWYWEVQEPERYGATKPNGSSIDKLLLDYDWHAIIAATEGDRRPGVELLVQLSSLIRVIGDHPAEVLKPDER